MPTIEKQVRLLLMFGVKEISYSPTAEGKA